MKMWRVVYIERLEYESYMYGKDEEEAMEGFKRELIAGRIKMSDNSEVEEFEAEEIGEDEYVDFE